MKIEFCPPNTYTDITHFQIRVENEKDSYDIARFLEVYYSGKADLVIHAVGYGDAKTLAGIDLGLSPR